MSILSGIKKVIPYFKNADGNYEQLSYKTSSQTVDFDDGKTAETKLGAINGITKSLNSTSDSVAISASAGKSLQDQITTLNSNIGNKQDVLNIGKFTGNINILSVSGSNLPPRSSVCWCNKAELDSKSIVPSGVNYFFLETWVSSVNLQRLTSYSDMQVYSRFYVNGSWTNWA